MCGLVGFYDQRGFSADSAKQNISIMSSQLSHRGPDAVGFWADNVSGIALGHRRLAILDLSVTGHQPMKSPSSRYIMAYNGEIYNHMQLRRELPKDIQWRGGSDTETLLAGIECWGLEETLKRSVGMFAVALWDKSERVLSLARDRIGEKPLYYGWQDSVFLFGSELKSLRKHTSFKHELNPDALPLYLRYKYVPTPHSIFKGIQKLTPGTIVQVRANKQGERTNVSPATPYWSLDDAVRKGAHNIFRGSENAAIQELDLLLNNAVALQSVADVPLGAFLSGGVDSTTIVALMQANSVSKIKTFTIGFEEKQFNEAVYAKAVAEYLGTDHTEYNVTSNDAVNIVVHLPKIYDEPFGDSSQIPTVLLSQLTKKHVKVSLSGDGGDELFGGYSRYSIALRLLNKLTKIPLFLRKICAKVLSNCHLKDMDRLYTLINVLSSRDLNCLYQVMISEWRNISLLVPLATETGLSIKGHPKVLDKKHIQQMMYWDTLAYLPDDILAKVDRAAMSVGLETRIPMLDHRVVEFAWSLPFSLKQNQNDNKWILRQLLYQYVPKKLIERPKMGFSAPVSEWLRGPLRPWAEELLNDKSLIQSGLNPDPIKKRWNEHVLNLHNWADSLWTILMYQGWMKEYHS